MSSAAVGLVTNLNIHSGYTMQYVNLKVTKCLVPVLLVYSKCQKKQDYIGILKHQRGLVLRDAYHYNYDVWRT